MAAKVARAHAFAAWVHSAEAVSSSNLEHSKSVPHPQLD